MRKPFKALTILFVLALLFTTVPSVGGAVEASSPANPISLNVLAADPTDWDLPTGGHYYTQTGGGAQRGFSITDEGGIPFWSEFKRMGGVASLGYPVSRRFEMSGYVCQAMQRVIFQWRPEAKAVSFVNVFDLLHDAGGDTWLEAKKQVPKPLGPEFTAGLDWNGTVQKRLALMDPFPAIKAQYNSVASPIEMNGLPTSGVTDMGDSYTIRCQRIVIQQWKKDMPWAKAGQVTVANGGDIAKDAGVVPVAAQMAFLPMIQTCGDEKQYVTFARAALEQLNSINSVLNATGLLALIVWDPGQSDEEKAVIAFYSDRVIRNYNSAEAALATLKQDITSQGCVPAKYSDANQLIGQALQKEIEGLQIERAAFQQRNEAMLDQAATKYRESNALRVSAALPLQ